jgi:hypothetical protein
MDVGVWLGITFPYMREPIRVCTKLWIYCAYWEERQSCVDGIDNGCVSYISYIVTALHQDRCWSWVDFLGWPELLTSIMTINSSTTAWPSALILSVSAPLRVCVCMRMYAYVCVHSSHLVMHALLPLSSSTGYVYIYMYINTALLMWPSAKCTAFDSCTHACHPPYPTPIMR